MDANEKSLMIKNFIQGTLYPGIGMGEITFDWNRERLIEYLQSIHLPYFEKKDENFPRITVILTKYVVYVFDNSTTLTKFTVKDGYEGKLLDKFGLGDTYSTVEKHFGPWQDTDGIYINWFIPSVPGVYLLLDEESGNYEDEFGVEQWDEERAKISHITIEKDYDKTIWNF